jgi:hypothetical protein
MNAPGMTQEYCRCAATLGEGFLREPIAAALLQEFQEVTI